MDILDLIHRNPKPSPWAEGEKIPWNDPSFSARMLKEHLSQQHHLASRKIPRIDQHVAWIHHQILSGQPGKVLDLCCGPGLYTSRLASMGHTCVGIDFSPASIAYAAADAADQEEVSPRRCRYYLDDIRKALYGNGYDLVMLIFGEFNVFKALDAAKIVQQAYAALVPGGQLLLEVEKASVIQQKALSGTSWYSSRSGLFSDQPHLCLTEDFWDDRDRAATRRYYVIDAISGKMTCYASSCQTYTEEELRQMLEKHEFCDVRFFPSLSGDVVEEDADFFVAAARKPTDLC